MKINIFAHRKKKKEKRKKKEEDDMIEVQTKQTKLNWLKHHKKKL